MISIVTRNSCPSRLLSDSLKPRASIYTPAGIIIMVRNPGIPPLAHILHTFPHVPHSKQWFGHASHQTLLHYPNSQTSHSIQNRDTLWPAHALLTTSNSLDP